MKEKWMDRLDLPEEARPRETVVEVIGYRRVLIEHHGGVTQYGSCSISVKVRFGCIHITGRHLELTRMTRDQLIISGCIEGVRIERMEKK